MFLLDQNPPVTLDLTQHRCQSPYNSFTGLVTLPGTAFTHAVPVPAMKLHLPLKGSLIIKQVPALWSLC